MILETLEKTQTKKEFAWNSVLELAKSNREEAAGEIYDNYFAELEEGEKISFSIPRVETNKYPILGLMREALEKKFPESEFPDIYSLKIIFSELLSNALDHGEGKEVEAGFSFDGGGITIGLHEQSKNALAWNDQEKKLEILFRGRLMTAVTNKINEFFKIKKSTKNLENDTKEKFILTPKSEIFDAADLVNERGRGFCVIAGYMDEGDELHLKINSDDTFTAEFFKSIERSDEI